MESPQLRISAADVRGVLGRYMQAEGLDVVADFERSRGSYLFDAQREEYFLDFFSFYASYPLGYNHPRLASGAIIRELGRVAIQKPTNSDVYSRELAEFVESFARLAKPSFMKYMFFIEGGALAVENALKAAFDWKVRKNFGRGSKAERGHQVLHFREAFHGRSGYTLSLTNTADANKTKYFPKFSWPRITNPKCTFPLEGENLEGVRRAEGEALEQIEAAIRSHADDIACLILEPIQAEGGDNHFRPEFHRALRRICDQHEIMMIYDEVQTGMGATGKMWGFEHFAEPDMVAFGKKSQVCGILVNDRIDEVPENVFHVPSRINSTWGGNLVDMLRCKTYLEIYEEENVLEHCQRMGKVLLEGIQQLQKEFPEKLSNARGLGLLCAFDLPSQEFRKRFREKLFEKRLLMLPCGERSIRFRTALNIPERDLHKGLQIIRDVLREM
ncbi:MAG: L-lysine 6-transaminase [Acidobacteria bacterium]|nr:L-lysine 6-transaminase [Acidobacteriota bacterium]